MQHSSAAMGQTPRSVERISSCKWKLCWQLMSNCTVWSVSRS